MSKGRSTKRTQHQSLYTIGATTINAHVFQGYLHAVITQVFAHMYTHSRAVTKTDVINGNAQNNLVTSG